MWVFCGQRFTEGDVIQWTENILEERRGRRKRKELVSLGTVRITAQLLRDDEEWIRLEVREVTVLEDVTEGRRSLRIPEAGAQIRRKRSTVERGKPRRLRWSDAGASAEPVRARVAVERRKKVKIRKLKGLSMKFGKATKRKPKPRR